MEFKDYSDNYYNQPKFRLFYWALWSVSTLLVFGAFASYIPIFRSGDAFRLVDALLLFLSGSIHTTFFLILLRQWLDWLYPQLPLLLFFVDFAFGLFALSVIRYTQPIF